VPRWGDPYWTPYDWDERPVITVAPELRAADREHVRIGDLMADSLSSIEPFLRWDTSVDRLKELRGELAAAVSAVAT
jgi:hypothetical protein